MASKTYEAFDQDGNGTNEPAGVVRYAYTSGGPAGTAHLGA